MILNLRPFPNLKHLEINDSDQLNLALNPNSHYDLIRLKFKQYEEVKSIEIDQMEPSFGLFNLILIANLSAVKTLELRFT